MSFLSPPSQAAPRPPANRGRRSPGTSTRFTKPIAHRRCRDDEADAVELANDALTAPARVSHAQDPTYASESEDSTRF